MKMYKLLLSALLVLILYSCSNTATSDTTSTSKFQSIEDRRVAYLKKMEWVAPEDMVIIEKGLTPFSERGFWDEDKRKQVFIDKLKSQGVADSTIRRLVIEVEQIRGTTGNWNYEYIQARFGNYKRWMEKDKEWKKIDLEYTNKLNSAKPN
jgi:hypothetical protein